MNKRFISVLVFAFVVSALATVVLYRLIVSQLPGPARTVAPVRPAKYRVVVASHTLADGKLIKDLDVKLADWNGPMPVGAVTLLEDAVGRGVLQTIYEGEAVQASRLAPRGTGGGLASLIPEGMRAVAVRVNDIVGIAGFVTPGMRVDVLIAGNPPNRSNSEIGTVTKTLLQDMEVLSAGQNIQKDAEGRPITVTVVTLLVTPEQAEILSLASNETRIQLVLRNPMDKATVATPGTALAYLFNARNQGGPKPAVKPALPPPPKPQVKPAPVLPDPGLTVEVLNGASKTEAKFASEKDQKEKTGGDQ